MRTKRRKQIEVTRTISVVFTAGEWPRPFVSRGKRTEVDGFICSMLPLWLDGYATSAKSVLFGNIPVLSHIRRGGKTIALG